MSRINDRLRAVDHGNGRRGLGYWCQGCEAYHSIVTEGAGAWGFNGNHDAPTFTPSVLTTYEHGPKRIKHVCHTFITDGRVQFLGDCTHALAGQTHDLPPLPDWLR